MVLGARKTDKTVNNFISDKIFYNADIEESVSLLHGIKSNWSIIMISNTELLQA